MECRAFVKNTVCFVIMAVLFWSQVGNPLHAEDQNADKAKEKIRVGLMTQRHGPHLGIYYGSLRECTGISQVATSADDDRELEVAKRVFTNAFGEAPVYRSHAKMVEEFKPDLVFVALPAHLSPAAIRVALEGGCHVVSEKPACFNAEQFAELVKLAKEKKRMLMLSLPSRVNPKCLRAREIIAKGLLGKLYAINVLQVKDQARLTRPDYQQSWYCDREKAGGGHLIWLGIHQMDQIPFITGDRVEKVTAFCRNVGGEPIKIEDAETVSMQFKSGMVGTFHGGYYLKGGSAQSGFTVWGSLGWLKMLSHRGPDGSSETFQWYSRHADAPEGVQTENPTSKVGGYQASVQAAIDAARGEREAPLTAEESLHVLKVIFAAYKSSETGTVQSVE